MHLKIKFLLICFERVFLGLMHVLIKSDIYIYICIYLFRPAEVSNMSWPTRLCSVVGQPTTYGIAPAAWPTPMARDRAGQLGKRKSEHGGAPLEDASR